MLVHLQSDMSAMRDFRFSPRSRWELRSSGLSRRELPTRCVITQKSAVFKYPLSNSHKTYWDLAKKNYQITNVTARRCVHTNGDTNETLYVVKVVGHLFRTNSSVGVYILVAGQLLGSKIFLRRLVILADLLIRNLFFNDHTSGLALFTSSSATHHTLSPKIIPSALPTCHPPGWHLQHLPSSDWSDNERVLFSLAD